MPQKLKLREAVSTIFQEIEKDGIKALLISTASVVWDTYRVRIVILGVSFLLAVSQWLKIPIVIPLPLVVIFIIFVLVILLRLRKLEANRKMRRPTNVVLSGLLYESAVDGTIFGPLCTRCGSKMIMVFDQNENVTRVVFGKDAIYKYSCTCGHEVDSSKTPDELLKKAQEHYQKVEFTR
jgi:hypothetical protein